MISKMSDDFTNTQLVANHLIDATQPGREFSAIAKLELPGGARPAASLSHTLSKNAANILVKISMRRGAGSSSDAAAASGPGPA